MSRCFNPDCLKLLNFLHEGQIYIFDVSQTGDAVRGGQGIGPRLEHSWLCRECSELFALEYIRSVGVRLVPKAECVLAS